MPNYTPRAQAAQRRAESKELAVHAGLVHWVVPQQWLGRCSYAEAVQAGRIGLWRALRGYDAGRGCTFSTYAVVAIRRAVWRAVAQSCAAEAEELVAEVAEAAPDLEAVAEAALVQAELAELVGQLPARLGRVIRGSYGLAAEATETYAALGRKLGVSRQRAHQMHSEALLWLGQPARSLRLRQRVGANTRGDYAAYQARVRAFQRRKRGRR